MYMGIEKNVNKTKVLLFEKQNKKSSRHTNYDFYLYNEKLEIVTSFIYLGVYFFLRTESGTEGKSV